MSLYDGGNKVISCKRRFCFGTDGTEGLSRVIPNGQICKDRDGAGNGRVKCRVPDNALRAVNPYGSNPHVFIGKRYGLVPFKRGRVYRINPFEIVIKSRRTDGMRVKAADGDLHRGVDFVVTVHIQIRGLIWRCFVVQDFESKGVFPVRELAGGHFAFPSYSGFAKKICYIRKFRIRILRAQRIINYFFIPNISGIVFYGNPVNEKADFDFVGPVFNEDNEHYNLGFNVDCRNELTLCGV